MYRYLYCFSSSIHAIFSSLFFSNGSGTAYAKGASYTANAAATLYAQWKSNEPAVGDYVAYTPPSGNHTTNGTTYNPANTTSWKIFSIDNGVISLIPATKAFDLTIGTEVLMNGFGSTIPLLFSAICDEYANSTYVQSVRHLGMQAGSAGTNTYTMNATDKAVLTAHPELNYSGDTFTTGYKLTGNIMNGSVYIEVCQSNGTLTYKHVVTDENGEINVGPNNTPVFIPGTLTTTPVTAAIRPIVTLKSTVRITGGNGTQANPFTIGI